MSDKTPLENAVRHTHAPVLDQGEMAAVSDRERNELLPANQKPVDMSELQRMEAEWVSRELEEFVKLIQQYRALYLGAIFVAVGWVLGQTVGGGATQGAQTPPPSLESLRQRQDVAAVLCVVPLLSVFLAALVAEAYVHMKSLARYRFLLGFVLGNNTPAWRWERWRETSEGSVRSWTNPLNILSVFILLIFTAGALIFPFPAVWNSNSWWLRGFWLLAASLSLGLVIALALLGIRNRHRNAVADPLTTQWSDLGFEKQTGMPREQTKQNGATTQSAEPNNRVNSKQ